MTDCDKGLLLLSVASMRSWAQGINSDKREVGSDGTNRLYNDTEAIIKRAGSARRFASARKSRAEPQ